MRFLYSVANANQIPTLLAIGKVTGKTKNKFDGSIPSLELVKCGNYSSKSQLDSRTIDSVLDFNPVVKPNKSSKNLSEKLNVSNVFTMLEVDDDDDRSDSEPSVKIASKTPSSSDLSGLAVAGSVAHLICRVAAIHDGADAGHAIVVARVEQAWVHYDYWSNNCKCFVASPEVPPTVKFLGSQKFGYVFSDDVLRQK